MWVEVEWGVGGKMMWAEVWVVRLGGMGCRW